jgi:hypothetical protein
MREPRSNLISPLSDRLHPHRPSGPSTAFQPHLTANLMTHPFKNADARGIISTFRFPNSSSSSTPSPLFSPFFLFAPSTSSLFLLLFFLHHDTTHHTNPLNSARGTPRRKRPTASPLASRQTSILTKPTRHRHRTRTRNQTRQGYLGSTLLTPRTSTFGGQQDSRTTSDTVPWQRVLRNPTAPEARLEFCLRTSSPVTRSLPFCLRWARCSRERSDTPTQQHLDIVSCAIGLRIP